MVKWWDEYEVMARYIPTFLSVIPIVHFLIVFVGRPFWGELVESISWMNVIVNLSLSTIAMLTVVQLQCSIGKAWIEESVFGKGGERFPTTDMLLYSTGLISKQRKEQLRSSISEASGYSFSTEEEEYADPAYARLQAREAVGHVRAKVGRGRMTIRYNIRYGFFRNLIAGVVWVIPGCLGCTLIYLFENRLKPMSLFIAYAIIFLALYTFKSHILKKMAYNYADTLFDEYSNCT